MVLEHAFSVFINPVVGSQILQVVSLMIAKIEIDKLEFICNVYFKIRQFHVPRRINSFVAGHQRMLAFEQSSLHRTKLRLLKSTRQAYTFSILLGLLK